MNRWLMIGSLAALLVGSTGCLHHNIHGGCASGTCSTGGCSTGDCGAGSCNGACGDANCNGGCGSGVLGKLGGLCGVCGSHGCRNGCVAGPLGWQQGGLDYSSHLQPGLLGHNAARNLNSRPFTPGPPTAHVGYPYYTVHGPRDFLVDDPPTIGR